MATVEKVLVIDFLDLPEEQQEDIKNFEAFGNDRILEYVSEMSPSDEEVWEDTLTHQAIVSYWQDQTDTNNYTGTLQEFISDYGLTFDVWLLSNLDFDFKVSKILINICW